MRRKSFFIALSLLFSVVLFVQCTKDDDLENAEKGTLTVKLTDAPSDDLNVQGTFVTVADVKIDGKSVEGFTKQTIEISAYQNGNTKLLLSGDVAAKSYNQITLVLDKEADASGNSPGCYVLTEDETKHDLFAETNTSGEISVSKAFEVSQDTETSVVVDFDLRKAVVRNQEGSGNSDYKFVTSAELQNAIRTAIIDECGEVSGEIENTFGTDAQTYVFIYKKGEFNASAESAGSGDSNVLFANAVTSAKVESDGSYKLAFLEEGDYEIHLASYEKTGENHFSFQGFLNANSTINNLLLNNISVSAQSKVKLDIEILSLL
ncbi:DUF4382 domain-containing protein [Mariniphaga sp.]|uniref:DUF4382 domain-containing protein n=1 Tax=Mariniphaga sp. TaxID=1954475 RepID=UPI0035643B80